MGLYDAMKDAINLAQKADNIELYRQLLDLSAQALELQAEVARLKEENAELKKKEDLSASIVRHAESFVTKVGDEANLRYCSHCWDADQKLIQLRCDEEDATFVCPHCKVSGIYDTAWYNAWRRRQEDDSSDMGFV